MHRLVIISVVGLSLSGCWSRIDFGFLDYNDSTATASPATIIADNIDASTLSVKLRYSASAPAQSLGVQLVPDDANTTVIQNALTTDATGLVTAQVRATTSGLKVVRAYITQSGKSYVLPVQVTVTAVTPHLAFAVTASPNAVTAGATTTLTVTAQSAGIVTPYYTGTVHFGCTDANVLASLPSTYTFTAADAGSHSFSNVLFTHAGVISVSVNADNGDTGQTSVTVAPDSAAQIVIQAPDVVVANYPISITVLLEDSYGNIDSHFFGVVTLSDPDPSATLPGPTQVSGGYAAFDGVVFANVGVTHLTASSTAVPKSTTVDIWVQSGSEVNSVGGVLSGLASGDSVTLKNGGDALVLSTNGNFQFGAGLVYQDPYNVQIAAAPVGQTCMITNGSGLMGETAVSNVRVACTSTAYTVSGSVSGLDANSHVALQLHGSAAINVVQNGNFEFPTTVTYESSYSVSVTAQPAGQLCAVQNANGVMGPGNVSNINVICNNVLYPIGGTVSGLAVNGNVSLTDNGADGLNITANGNFVFPTKLPYEGNYVVAITAQPVGQVCTVQGGSGSVPASAVSSVAVVCSSNRYTVGGTVAGLLSNSNVTLADNATDTLTLAANGNFNFALSVPYEGNYNVTVKAQPTGQTCTVTSPTGTMGAADVNNVTVDCQANAYAVGVVASGLTGSVTVTDGTDSMVVSTNGNNFFPTPLTYNSTYSVSITSQPPTQTCTLTNGSSLTVPGKNSTLTGIACVGYTLGGTVTGLDGNTLVLVNGSQTVSRTSDGSFAFPATLPPNASYAVTVMTQPIGEGCNVYRGSGVMGNANNTAITVICSQTLTLANNQNAFGAYTEYNYASVAHATDQSRMQTFGEGNPYFAANGITYMADTTNNRLMGYPTIIPTNCVVNTASALLGQTSYTAFAVAPTSATSLSAPIGVASTGNTLLVSDSGNNRVLEYATLPTGIGAAATSVVGQGSMTTMATGCTGTTLKGPAGAIYANNGLVIADTNNNRVLIWASASAAYSQQNPDVVLGQSSLTTCAAQAVSATSLKQPKGLYFDGKQLFVADYGNNRVLVYSNFAALTNGNAANFAIGQPDMNTASSGCTTSKMNKPWAITGSATQLVIALESNTVGIFTPVPTAAGAAETTYLGGSQCAGQTVGINLFSQPSGVAIYKNTLAVFDGNARLVFFQGL